MLVPEEGSMSVALVTIMILSIFRDRGEPEIPNEQTQVATIPNGSGRHHSTDTTPPPLVSSASKGIDVGNTF